MKSHSSSISIFFDDLSNSSYFNSFNFFKDNNQSAFGVVLFEMSLFENILASELVLVPTEEQKEELKNAVDELPSKIRKFLKKAGDPQVFIVWHID